MSDLTFAFVVLLALTVGLVIGSDGDWKIHCDPTVPWWNFLAFRYTVVRPGGGVVACEASLRAARRRIKKEQRKGPPVSYWERPIVWRERADG